MVTLLVSQAAIVLYVAVTPSEYVQPARQLALNAYHVTTPLRKVETHKQMQDVKANYQEYPLAVDATSIAD